MAQQPDRCSRPLDSKTGATNFAKGLSPAGKDSNNPGHSQNTLLHKYKVAEAIPSHQQAVPESEDKVKDMLEDLNSEGKKDGTRLNIKITKVMCNKVVRRRQRTGVLIDGEQLEEVTVYKKLGRFSTLGNDISKEIAQQITSGWRRFGDYSHFLKDRKIPIFLKRKIMDTVISPA